MPERTEQTQGESVREIIEDIKGDLYLYSVGEIDLPTLANAIQWSGKRLAQESDV
jgi:hypothetical protein